MMKIKNKNKCTFLIITLILFFSTGVLFSANIQKKIYFLKFSRKKGVSNKKLLKFIRNLSFDISSIISFGHEVYYTEVSIPDKKLLQNGYEFSVTGRFIIGFKTVYLKILVSHLKSQQTIFEKRFPIKSLDTGVRFKLVHEVAQYVSNAINNFNNKSPSFVSVTPKSGEYNKPIKLNYKIKPKNAVVRYTISYKSPPKTPTIKSEVLTQNGITIDKNAFVKLRVFSKFGTPGQIVDKKFTFKPLDIKVSHSPGKYKNKIVLKITENPSGGKVYYTFARGKDNADIPDKKSLSFPKQGVVINHDVEIKVRVIKEGWTKGHVLTYKYNVYKPQIKKKPKPKKEIKENKEKTEKKAPEKDDKLKDNFNIHFKGQNLVYGWFGLEFKALNVIYLNLQSGYWQGTENGADFQRIPLVLNMSMRFFEQTVFTPFFSFGFGYIFKLSGNINAQYLLNLSLGFEFYIGRHFTFFGEAGLYYIDDVEYHYGGGFKIYLK